jgi:hypothetical protein
MHILISGHHPSGVYSQVRSQCFGKGAGLNKREPIVARLVGYPTIIVPDRFTIGPPQAGQCPAGQGLARVPFALTIMEHPSGAKPMSQTLDQRPGDIAFGRAYSSLIPLLSFPIVHRYEGGLSPKGKSRIVGMQLLVDVPSEAIDSMPLLIGVGLGGSRILMDPLERHRERELAFGLVHGPGDRRSA